jgi:thymidylate synthase (FAD)
MASEKDGEWGVRFWGDNTIDKFGARPNDPDAALASARILDHGNVTLLSTYGSDLSICEAARVSYGKGTVSKRDPEALLRYLMRHRHTSPFEQAEVTFFLRVPIFVARQLIRHRTANVNEYSARYSELSDDFYIPAPTHVATQSTTNRQGSGESLDDAMSEKLESAQIDILQSQQNGVETYHRLLTTHGVSRETARIVTSVGTYTEMYWKCDLHNFLHFLNLRMDAHAQQEIRDLATAMYWCARPFFPIVVDAWNDYVRNSYTLSAAECRMLGDILRRCNRPGDPRGGTVRESWPNNTYDMSDREHATFRSFLDKLLPQ